MTPMETLIETLRANHPGANVALVENAYLYAEKAHEGQMRISGKPYFTHAVATAQTLADWHLPDSIVIAGLLHDVPEDTATTPEGVAEKLKDIAEHFGKDSASLVEGVTKLGKIQYHGVERYVENLRKMFMAVAQDVRVIFIKFADRLDNLKDLDIVPEQKRIRIAKEALEIYAPIANRLGMGAIKGDLEDLSFQYVHPSEYRWVVTLLEERVPPREEYLEKIGKIAKEDLKKSKIIPISVHGRVKRLYSLYKKILEKDRDIAKVHDLVAERIIVQSVQDCYATLGILHQRWTPLKGRIKDYVAQPKPNGYQSLHTTVFCEDGEIVEFQIRTQQMHDEAEFGIAAHWFYTEQGKKSVIPDRQLKWLKDLTELQKNIHDHTKFLETLESLKIDFFNNRIFVFTPKGDVIDLPEGATPVDYAYAIHTEIGNKCTAARVNDQMVQLTSTLRSGDVITIITDKNRKGPSSDWMEFAKTSHARSKIKEAVKKTKLTGWIKELVKKKN
ncbi:MAG: RelA/SpoT family protein [bacterium]|nr:RelA/SpoT family protein [bacterium]